MPTSLFLEMTASAIATITSEIAIPTPGTVAAGTNAIKIDTGKNTIANQHKSLFVGTNFIVQSLNQWRIVLQFLIFTLCAMPFPPTMTSQPVTRNPQPATRNSSLPRHGNLF
jgi:hypothetical protein